MPLRYIFSSEKIRPMSSHCWYVIPDTHNLMEERFILANSLRGLILCIVWLLQGKNGTVVRSGRGKLLSIWWSGIREKRSMERKINDSNLQPQWPAHSQGPRFYQQASYITGVIQSCSKAPSLNTWDFHRCTRPKSSQLDISMCILLLYKNVDTVSHLTLTECIFNF